MKQFIIDKNNLKQSFVDYVFSNCLCKEQCNPIDIITKTKVFKEPIPVVELDENPVPIEIDICNEIKIEIHNTIEEYNKSIKNYEKSIADIIQLMTHLNFIKIKHTNNMYLNTKEPFRWDSIKKMYESNYDSEYISYMWLFRKVIVDLILNISIMYVLLEKKKKESRINIFGTYTLPELHVFSVGSTRVTSDYDITVYTNDSIMTANILKKFNHIFIKYFKYKSSEVFDTNIYGRGFILFTSPSKQLQNIYEYYDSCTPYRFNYIKDNESCYYSQFMWAICKLIKDIPESIDILKSYKDSNVNKLINYSTSMINYLDNKTRGLSYEKVILNEEEIKNKYNKINQFIAETDYISLANYYGIETYFSKGAFMHTVINLQMCTVSKINLSNNDYACSIVENAAFYLHSHKEKYLIRINDALKHFSHLAIKETPSDTEIYNLIIYIIKNQLKTYNFSGYPTFIKVFKDKLLNVDEPLNKSTLHLPQIVQETPYGSQQSLSGLMSRRQSDVTVSRRPSDLYSRRRSSDLSFKFPDINSKSSSKSASNKSSIQAELSVIEDESY